MAKRAPLSPEQIKQLMAYEGVNTLERLAQKIAERNAPDSLHGNHAHIHHILEALKNGSFSIEIAECFDEYCAQHKIPIAA